MRVFSNYTIILATIFSTIIHFFALTLLDTFALIPRRIAPRPTIFMVNLLPLEKKGVTPKKEVQKRGKRAIKKDKGVILTKRTKVKKEKQKINNEQKRLAAIKEIERKVAQRKAEETSETVANSQMELYFGMVRERVKRFWVIPDTLLDKEGLEAVIVIEIDKDGLLMGSKFERSSGNPYFDQSAMRAINKAVPFPTPPLGKIPLEIGLVFQPR
ncbi:MAG: TonB family protein [Deltaproteobacteria bacterium]|nr:TonB family protein [Deltaproteobacteria bacterium]